MSEQPTPLELTPEAMLGTSTVPMTTAAAPASGTNVTSWRAGQSGNPRGKPLGTRNFATQMLENALHSEAEQVGRKVIDLALEGNVAALRMCMDRLAPRLRVRASTTEVDLPPISSAADLPAAFSAVVQATARGEINSEEAKNLATILELKRKAFETLELEQRLASLEKVASRDRRAL